MKLMGGKMKSATEIQTADEALRWCEDMLVGLHPVPKTPS
jgi:hypothetical protein